MIAAVGLPRYRSLFVGSFHWQFCFFPRFPTAGNIPKLVKAFRFQNTGGEAGPISASTINSRRLVTIEFVNSFAQLREKNVACVGNMSLFPLTGRTHIE